MVRISMMFDDQMWSGLKTIAKENGFNTRATFVRKCVTVVLSNPALLSEFGKYEESMIDNDEIIESFNQAVEKIKLQQNSIHRQNYELLLAIAGKLGVINPKAIDDEEMYNFD